MSTINLLAHQKELKEAWEEVLDQNRPTNWALFGYEGQTYNLMLVSKGDGGLEELQDEFQSAAIMYAFCTVSIPPSGVKRNVLINWQGEGAPVVRKGCCANHLAEVERFFKGHQLTINARSDDEVEPRAILEQLVKCCAAASIQRASDSIVDNPSAGPVSSVYQRVQPQKDVTSMSEREKFWQQQQEEEKRRAKEEKKNMEQRQRNLKDEELRRETNAAKAREEKYRQDSIEKTANGHNGRKASSGSVKKIDTSMWEKQIAAAEKEGKPAIPLPSQKVMRKKNIGGVSAVFENQKPAEPTASTNKNNVPGKIVIPKFENKPVEKTVIQMPQKTEDKEYSYTKNLLTENRRESLDTGNNHEEEQDWEEEPLEEPPTKIPDPLVDAMVEQGIIPMVPQTPATNTISASSQPEPEPEPTVPLDKGQCARALYDYRAADDTEISFDPNDIISNIDQIDEGWWQGVAPDGMFGLFPANYVELI
ncbi:drebrin-like protein B [Galendromus occidentalis]|uniref:Drebrin-like protein B n=1 Tax=Galendromus occidentalis TaxID=34638 RepID=A0AAJ6VWG7_9ACAR|nr:drebrin-like protein B [Galendromus occidentalis]